MSREEAIAFLQDIKMNLEFLQNHYTQQKQELQQHAKVSHYDERIPCLPVSPAWAARQVT